MGVAKSLDRELINMGGLGIWTAVTGNPKGAIVFAHEPENIWQGSCLPTWRIDALSGNACMNGNHSARLGLVRSLGNSLERLRLRSLIFVRTRFRGMIFARLQRARQNQ